MVKQLCELFPRSKLNLSKLVNGLKGSQCREAESLSADSRKRSSLRKKTFDKTIRPKGNHKNDSPIIIQTWKNSIWKCWRKRNIKS